MRVPCFPMCQKCLRGPRDRRGLYPARICARSSRLEFQAPAVTSPSSDAAAAEASMAWLPIQALLFPVSSASSSSAVAAVVLLLLSDLND